MDLPADQTTANLKVTPVRTQNGVIGPMVDDLAECFSWMVNATAEINALKLEVKRQQPNNVQINPPVGGSGSVVVVSDVDLIVVTPTTDGDVTTYTITLAAGYEVRPTTVFADGVIASSNVLRDEAVEE